MTRDKNKFGDQCDLCEKDWAVHAWRINMQTNEFLCATHFAERSQQYAYTIRYDFRGQDGPCVKRGMKIFDRIQARLSDRGVLTSAQSRLARSQETFPDDWHTRFTFYDGDMADVLAVVESLRGIVRDALATDGTHHKQWYLRQMALSLGVDGDDWPEGTAP